MLGLHSTDQSNRRAAPIRIPFDPQRHVRRAPGLVTPAGPIPAPSAVLRSPRSCWGWVGPGIANRAPDGKSSMTAIYLADPRRTFGIRRNFGVELEVLLGGCSDVAGLAPTRAVATRDAMRS